MDREVTAHSTGLDQLVEFGTQILRTRQWELDDNCVVAKLIRKLRRRRRDDQRGACVAQARGEISDLSTDRGVLEPELVEVLEHVQITTLLVGIYQVPD